MTKGYVNKILPFSSVDGPGNRTAIFLQGCNFNCLYCHNPETIKRCSNCGICINECPYNALSINNGIVMWNKEVCESCDKCIEVCPKDSSPKVMKMSVDELVNVIKRTKSFISGVTISGGECSLQPDFVSEVFKKVKELGLTTFLDTNGYVSRIELEKIAEYMDMAMVDIKSYDKDEHIMLTGKDNKIVLENVKYLTSINKLYEIRTVIVPESLNNNYNVDMISRFIASLNPNIRYKLIKYRPIGVRGNMVKSGMPSDDKMIELYDLATKNGCKNVVLI